MYKSFTSFVRFILTYFIIFYAIFKGVDFFTSPFWYFIANVKKYNIFLYVSLVS